jgi:hypothetical protein
MSEESIEGGKPSLAGLITPAFDGFPYLVTRIGHTPLRHIALLPADWPPERLLEIGRRQVLANRLDTGLCLGRAAAVYLDADGVERSSTILPWGVPLMDRLELPEAIPVTPELTARRARLEEFVERHRCKGYLVGDGLGGGRQASEEDLRRLAGRDEQGVPRGLILCKVCGSFRGEYLAPWGEFDGVRAPAVVSVHCICQNHNRCARCGRTLAPRRLSAYSCRYPRAGVVYLAAYAGLGHRCF